MKKSPFIGRLDEMRRLKNLTRKKSASLVVVYGRRRVGKSRLIEEFGEKVSVFEILWIAACERGN